MQVRSLSRQCGVTLVESAAVLGVVSILVGSGLPTLNELRSSRVLEVAAAELRTDLQYARSTAVALGQSVRLHVASGPTGSCYVLHTGGPSACTCSPVTGSVCTPQGESVRSVQFGPGHTVALRSNSTSMAFDGTQGTVTPTGTLTMSNNRGGQLKLVVNVMGRVRACKASGTLTGYPAC